MNDVVWDYTTVVIRRNSILPQGQPAVRELVVRQSAQRARSGLPCAKCCGAMSRPISAGGENVKRISSLFPPEHCLRSRHRRKRVLLHARQFRRHWSNVKIVPWPCRPLTRWGGPRYGICANARRHWQLRQSRHLRIAGQSPGHVDAGGRGGQRRQVGWALSLRRGRRRRRNGRRSRRQRSWRRHGRGNHLRRRHSLGRRQVLQRGFRRLRGD